MISDAAVVAVVSGIVSLITGSVTVVTTILRARAQERQMNQQFKKAEIERAWAVEDGRRKADELAAKTQLAAVELKQESIAQREAMLAHAQEVSEKLDQAAAKLDYNTELTGKAHEAANNFQTKLDQLAKVFGTVHVDQVRDKGADGG